MGSSPSQRSSGSRRRPLTTWTLTPGAHRQPRQEIAERRVGSGQVGGARERHERAVVVEQEEQPLGAPQARDERVEVLGRAQRRLRLFGVAGARRPARRGSSCAQWCTSRDAIRSRRARIRTRRSSSGITSASSNACAIVVDVVRVHLQRFAHLGGGAGELAQHEDAVFVRPRRDELLGDEVHPVAERRDQHHVRGAIERDHVLARSSERCT